MRPKGCAFPLYYRVHSTDINVLQQVLLTTVNQRNRTKADLLRLQRQHAIKRAWEAERDLGVTAAVSEHEGMWAAMLGMSAAIFTLFIWTTALTQWLLR